MVAEEAEHRGASQEGDVADAGDDTHPFVNPDAVRSERLSYDEVLARKLGVMDLTAICLCQDHHMPVRVFAMDKPGALLSIVMGGDEGTLIE